jgi:hypothetical protein
MYWQGLSGSDPACGSLRAGFVLADLVSWQAEFSLNRSGEDMVVADDCRKGYDGTRCRTGAGKMSAERLGAAERAYGSCSLATGWTAPAAIDRSRSSGEGSFLTSFVPESQRGAQIMTRHKFAIGQAVDFNRRLPAMSRPSGPYEVIGVLPVDEANSPTYRVKSKAEPFVRTAREIDLVAVGSAPCEQAAAALWPEADPVPGRQSPRPFRSR